MTRRVRSAEEPYAGLPAIRSAHPTIFRPLHPRVSLLPSPRLTAGNPGPFTLHGTNSYIVGRGRVAVIDPGPDDPAHVAALLAATRGETITHILVTHTHRDHSGAVAGLKAASGAATAGGGPHRPARPAPDGAAVSLDASADTGFMPEIVLADGAVVDGDGWRLEAVTTPGHTANHLVFALAGTDLAFSGDHVMGWSTTVIAPPDGAMDDYLASLDKLLARRERRHHAGHGDAVDDAQARLRALKAHRAMREAAILDRLAKGDRTIAEIVAAVYREVDPRLHGAAGLSVLAHLQSLVERGRVVAADGATLASRYRPA